MKRIREEEIDGVIYIDGVDIIKKLSEGKWQIKMRKW